MGNIERRFTTINKTETKIKYLLVSEKVYKVTHTDFSNLIIEASETDLSVSDVPADELFDVMDFKEFHVKLKKWHGVVIEFVEYVKKWKEKS